MRDWKLEDVKREGGTPSCLALKPYEIHKDFCHTEPGTYWICVTTRGDIRDDIWIVGLEGDRFLKTDLRDWYNIRDIQSHEFERKHGALVYPCLAGPEYLGDDPEDDPLWWVFVEWWNNSRF